MGNTRTGLSVAQAATVTGLSESTVRRWADNGIAEAARQPLPHPGQGKLKAWRAATRRGSAGVAGTGQERRIDPADAERIRRQNAGEPTKPEAATANGA